MSDVATTKSVWPTALAVIGVFAIFLLILLVAHRPAVPLDQVASAPEEEQWKLTAEGREAKLQELRGQAQTGFRTYQWLDQGAGIVQLPVERAMELTVAELSAQR